MYRGRIAGTICIAAACMTMTGQAAPAAKRLETSRRHQEWAEIKTPSGRTVCAFTVFPEVNRPVPTVVVIHENQGLTDWVRGVADQLAEAGYVAVAPDLLSQTGPEKGGTDSFGEGDGVRKAIYALPPDQVLADLDATVRYARDLSATSDVVAVAGFCWGGGQSFRYAAHNDRIAAAMVFYGAAPTEPESLGKIRVPVYGFYGGNDFRISGEVPKVTESMKKLGKRFEPVIYAGAGHGFMRSGEAPTGPEADRTVRDQAWIRWKEILGKL